MKTNIYILLAVLITLCSCQDYLTKEIPFEDVGFEPLLVINSNINSETQMLDVSVSNNINFANASSAQYTLVDNVEVSLTIGNESFQAETIPSGESDLYNYRVDISGVEIINQNLRLEAKHPDFPVASSEIFLPKASEYESQAFEADATTKVIFGYTEVYDKITATFQDDPDQENYYSFKILQVGEPDTAIYDADNDGQLDTFIFQNSYFSELATDDPNGLGVGQFPNEILFSDKNFNGQSYSFEILALIWGQDEDIVLQYENISESDFFFRQSYVNYLNAQDFGFFAEPVTLYSNIDQGLGVFRAFDRQQIPIEQ